MRSQILSGYFRPRFSLLSALTPTSDTAGETQAGSLGLQRLFVLNSVCRALKPTVHAPAPFRLFYKFSDLLIYGRF